MILAWSRSMIDTLLEYTRCCLEKKCEVYSLYYYKFWTKHFVWNVDNTFFPSDQALRKRIYYEGSEVIPIQSVQDLLWWNIWTLNGNCNKLMHHNLIWEANNLHLEAITKWMDGDFPKDVNCLSNGDHPRYDNCLWNGDLVTNLI